MDTAQSLVDGGWTSPAMLAIEGRSAGGLLMGAVLNMAPQLFKVAAQAYPALLITAGLNDPRVAYWEPAKWTATLRDLKTDDNPLLLKVRSSFCTAPSREELGGYTREKERTLPT